MTDHILFIGGPKHGERIAVRSLEYEVPVFECKAAGFSSGYAAEPSSPYVHRVEYRRRNVSLLGLVVSVMVPRNYTDNEAWRALADFIEGTAR